MVCYVLKFVNSIIRFVNTLPVDQRCYLTVVQKMLPFLLGHPVDQIVWIGHFTRIETSNFLVYLETKNWGKLAKIPSFLPWRNHNNMFSTIFFQLFTLSTSSAAGHTLRDQTLYFSLSLYYSQNQKTLLDLI